MPERPGASEIAYHFESLDFKSNERRTSAYLADFEPIAEDKLKSHQHPGFGIPARAEGRVRTEDRDREYELEPGDSVYFDPNVPHTYRRVSKTACQALIVTAE